MVNPATLWFQLKIFWSSMDEWVQIQCYFRIKIKKSRPQFWILWETVSDDYCRGSEGQNKWNVTRILITKHPVYLFLSQTNACRKHFVKMVKSAWIGTKDPWTGKLHETNILFADPSCTSFHSESDFASIFLHAKTHLWTKAKFTSIATFWSTHRAPQSQNYSGYRLQWVKA